MRWNLSWRKRPAAHLLLVTLSKNGWQPRPRSKHWLLNLPGRLPRSNNSKRIMGVWRRSWRKLTKSGLPLWVAIAMCGFPCKVLVACRLNHLERDVSQKRTLVDDFRLRLKLAHENAQSDADVLLEAENKMKGLTDANSRLKTQVESFRQRIAAVTKEKYENEDKVARLSEELERKGRLVSDLQRKSAELERTVVAMETSAQEQLHQLANQSEEAIDTAQARLIQANHRLKEFSKFLKVSQWLGYLKMAGSCSVCLFLGSLSLHLEQHPPSTSAAGTAQQSKQAPSTRSTGVRLCLPEESTIKGLWYPQPQLIRYRWYTQC